MLCNFCILAWMEVSCAIDCGNHTIKCYHSRRHGLRPSLPRYKNYITFYILLNYIILTNNK